MLYPTLYFAFATATAILALRTLIMPRYTPAFDRLDARLAPSVASPTIDAPSVGEVEAQLFDDLAQTTADPATIADLMDGTADPIVDPIDPNANPDGDGA